MGFSKQTNVIQLTGVNDLSLGPEQLVFRLHLQLQLTG